MIYRIRIDMMFSESDPALDILDKCKDHQDQAITINPGQPNEEHSTILYQDCTHNAESPEPCIPVYQWESS